MESLEVSDLKFEIVQLQKEIAVLRGQNKKLKGDLEEADAMYHTSEAELEWVMGAEAWAGRKATQEANIKRNAPAFEKLREQCALRDALRAVAKAVSTEK